jgi:hypothetical protein
MCPGGQRAAAAEQGERSQSKDERRRQPALHGQPILPARDEHVGGEEGRYGESRRARRDCALRQYGDASWRRVAKSRYDSLHLEMMMMMMSASQFSQHGLWAPSSRAGDVFTSMAYVKTYVFT